MTQRQTHHPQDIADAALVRAAQARDDAAFSTLINRHRGRVLGRVRAILRDLEEAEDAAQEVFVLAYRRLGDLQDADRFPAWLLTIAVRVAVKHRRQREMERERMRPLHGLPEIASEPVGLGQPEFGREDLRDALNALPAAHRTVTSLFYLARLDQAEIARLLDVPLGTVKSRLSRSRQLLKGRLTNMMETGTKHSEDYGRAVVAGMRGMIHWRSLLEGGLDGWQVEGGQWSRTGETIIGEDPDREGARLSTGAADWTDYELSVLLTPITGGNAQILFRVSEDNHRWYVLDLLMGWQAIAISEVDLDRDVPVQKLSVVNFPLEHGREYDIVVAARGASLTSYVDGHLVNQVTEFTHRSGPVSLTTWQSRTAFRDPRLRLLF